jgi:hypothetical protein
MSDKIKIIVGVLMIFILLVAIVFVYLSPKTFFSGLGVKKNVVVKTEKIVLNEDYKDPDEYTLITINDIIDGRVLKAEREKAEPFAEEAIPLKYKRVDVAYNQANLVLDSTELELIKKDPLKSPFKNRFFYKIKNGDIWYTIMGQQVLNSDGSTSFLHFLIHKGEEIYSWGRNSFFVEPMVIVPDQYFTELGPREFFSADKDYYMNGGKIDSLVNSWLKTGIVPDELQKEVLLMTIKW